MRFIGRRFIRERRLAAAATVIALALAAPIPGASAATSLFGFRGGAFTPFAFPVAGTAFPAAQQGSVGGAVFSQPFNGTQALSGCGTSRPSIGATGGTSAEVCGAVLAFIGPSIGAINSQVGPTIIGSTILGPVITGGGSVTNTVP
jgi:hypothetical protein